jgi:negative regulator of replication initiation
VIGRKDMQIEITIRMSPGESEDFLKKVDIPGFRWPEEHEVAEPQSSIESGSPIAQYIASPQFQAETQPTRRFLLLLGKIHALREAEFLELVFSESGKVQGRKFLGHSEEEVNSSGKSMQAKRIPGTGDFEYWVETGSSTDKKRKHMARWMTRLNFDLADIKIAVTAIGETRSRSL